MVTLIYLLKDSLMKEEEVLELGINVIQTNQQTRQRLDTGHASFGNQGNQLQVY